MLKNKKDFLMNDMLNSYLEGVHSYDEMITPNNRISEIWKQVFENLENIGLKEISERQREIQRLVVENGITYNVYGDPRGENRPWELNPLPFIISQQEWTQIEKGLIQRAELMNLILTDLYSERTLLKQGLIPVDLIYSNAAFLKQCDKTLDNNRKNLVIYAVDIARGPDNNWWVINDSAQAPSGLGYTLENRMTLGRVFPELIQNINIRKISGFYQALHQALSEISPRKNENPRIVLLTPGPFNETYFEHSYLTTFLRYPLVQGGDLTVQNGCVWLKTMKGLNRVDVILRRVDDTFCDPLELLDYSQLGIPGLLEAVRKKNVAIVNPLGSGILENPALNSFLPGIAKYYLNEDLILSPIATWWCGQKDEMKYVLKNLNHLIVKRLRKRFLNNTIQTDKLSKNDIESLKSEILKSPFLFAGQEKVNFSTTPVFTGNTIEPRFSVVRCFVIYSNGSYIVMPGGLTRTALQKGNLMVSNQLGGASQDTFIIGQQPDLPAKLTVFSKESNFLSTDIGTIPSRVAENLYWTGRYASRALATARLIRTTLKNLVERNISEYKEDVLSLEILLKTLTQTTMSYPGFVGEGSEERLKNPENEIFSLIFDNDKSGGLSYTLSALKNASEAVKNIWSTDTRRIIDHIDHQWKIIQNQKTRNLREIHTPLDQLITLLIAFMGLIKESVTREQGRIVYDIGLRLEHAIHIISKIRSSLTFKQEEAVENTVIEAILISHESLNIYRNSFRTYRLTPLLELLLLNVRFPSSLAYQLDFLEKRFPHLPKKENNFQLSEIEKGILEAFTKLRLSEPSELIAVEKDSLYRKNLDEFLSFQTDILFKISLDLSKNYFSHTNDKQQFITQSLSI